MVEEQVEGQTKEQSERQIKLTTCARDCPDACGIQAYVTRGRIVGMAGARGHEYTRNFLCRKAMDYVKRVYSPDRVLAPLQKVNGGWQEITWDKALTVIADRLAKTIEDYGSLSVLHYQSAGSLGALKMLNKRFFNLLGGVTEASGSLCGGAGIAGQKADFGLRTCHDPLDVRNSKLVLIWGRNPSDTNIHLMPLLKEIRARGSMVALIDPLNTDTEKFCDIHIQPKPGMDGYLALAMARVVLDSEQADMDFVASHCDNFEQYRELVYRFELDELSARCGVPVADIEKIAALYAGSKPASIMLGWGLQRYQWGDETFRLIDALGALTGNIGVAGGGVNHGRDELGYIDTSVKGTEIAKRSRKIPKPLLGRAIRELDDPPIKMAFINGGNPVAQTPDSRSVREALEGIDFVVVFEQFLTDTAETADIVLPVTTHLEETDLVGSYWHTYIGLASPVIEPLGEAKTDLEIYQSLARHLGIGIQMSGSAEDWIKKMLRPLNKDGITLEALRERHMRIPDIPAVPFEDKRFRTESGKLNLITAFSAPELGGGDYPLVLLSTHSRRWMHSQVLPPEHQEPLVVSVNPATAGAYGVADGGTARIVSPTGELRATVKHDESQKEGTVQANQGRWGKFDQCLNTLTQPLMSNEGQNACYYQTTVRLEKT